MPVNSQNPTRGNSFEGNRSTPSNAGNFNGFIPARVLEVSLTPDGNKKSLFQATNGWYGIGAIKFEYINKGTALTEYPQGNIAYPIDINFRQVPLVNEIVFIILGPSNQRTIDGNSDGVVPYYTNTVNMWNGVHLNASPSTNTAPPSNTNVNSISDIESGDPNNANTPIPDPTYGKVFEENPLIRNLYPQEGDVVIEGRFGQSLRFGSTNKQPTGSLKEIQSPWSTFGNNGSPITILRNGQDTSILNFDNWFPVYENINLDDSSIYMTSNQRIGVNLASTNLESFGIDITQPEDTTAIIQQVELGSEFESNKKSDALNQTRDSVNVEPNLSTDPNQPQKLFEPITFDSVNVSDLPTSFDSETQETDFNIGNTSDEDNPDNQTLSFAQRKRKAFNRGEGQSQPNSNVARKRQLRGFTTGSQGRGSGRNRNRD